MPLTIEQALNEIPFLKSAKVVAGGENLKNIVRWTHIVDHPDVLPWVQEGYLLLTTAFSLMLTPEIQTKNTMHSFIYRGIHPYIISLSLDGTLYSNNN